ncbi:MAG: hypothetical protein ACOYN8_16550 [Pseudanabaena sp.]|jgi:hypothetical protein
MQRITNNIKWIMLISGLLTCTLFYAAIAPQAALRSTFGDSLDGALAEIIVRNWGALITLVGVMQIYGAFKSASRSLILVVASVSKLTFITLVLVYGRAYLGQQAGVAIAIDAIAVILFIIYLIDKTKTEQTTTPH